jgi:Helicase associated domain
LFGLNTKARRKARHSQQGGRRYAKLRCAVASSSTKWQTERWESGFAALSKFRAREGHCCPLQPRVEGKFKLGKWVSVQRYRKEFLLPERKRRLDAIGFVWDWRDDLWEQNFAALLKFKRREGRVYQR